MNKTEITKNTLEARGLTDPKPNLPFLSQLTNRYVATFPFSSVGCRLGDELSLDLASLHDRIVRQRRGGYCFEQNGLMFEILQELGFSVELYLARVIYNKTTHPALTHRITLTQIAGKKYVVDVGFGALGPRVPVAFSQDETVDGDNIFRVAEPTPGQFHLQVFKDGNFFSLYKFELAQYGLDDCEVGHFYSHKHPSAAFVNNLVASLILKDSVLSLRNLKLWRTNSDGPEIIVMECAEQLHKTLVEEFGILITKEEGLRLFNDLI